MQVQGRGEFVELGHFDKHFVKNTQKRAPQGNVLEFFFLHTLKTIFCMEKLTQRWSQSGPFYSEIRTLFSISKMGRGGLPSPPLVAHLSVVEHVLISLNMPKYC